MITLVEQWHQSGLSQAGFAKAHNIKLAKLRYLIHKQRHGERHASGFIQLNGVPSTGISIRYPNGVELVLPAQTSTGLLRSLIHI